MTHFVLDVTDLLEQPGSRKALAFDDALEGLQTELSRVDAEAPMHFELVAESVEEGILVRGPISARYTTTCRRCLAETPARLDVDVAEVFRPGEDVWEEGYVIQDRSIDLRPMVRDNVLLNMPTDPLCGPDCRGLCSSCGTNLNLGACECPAEEADDRWAALRSLLER